jgi:flavin reductase (DIM6/NTAB) family NADH-FMN oxidoreductase RutF
MFYEADANDHGLPYNPIKACVVPRPIGWISTMSAAGDVNLAPFSFFNVLSYDPAYVTFSAGGHTDDGGIKDSVVNAGTTGEFVYNMATWDQRLQMNETALITERGADEMAVAGLEGLPSRMVRPPRVKGSPVHFECVHHQTVVLPGRSPEKSHHMVIGRVVGVHIDDAALTADGLVDVLKIRPIARLGYKDYTSVEAIFSMPKLSPEDTPKDIDGVRDAAE